jgi:threonine dehydrogenase-like Zn-dependent dehydrogenase
MSDVHFMMHDWATPKMSKFGTKCAGHEVSAARSDYDAPTDLLMGLQGAGVVVKVGKGVNEWKVGDRGESTLPDLYISRSH